MRQKYRIKKEKKRKYVWKEVINASKSRDGILATYFSRKFSKILTYYIVNHTRLTPNQITFLSLIIAILSSVLFLMGEYLYVILGVIFLQFSFILDCVDGEVARVKKMKSEYGAWLDSVFDRIKDISIFISITLGLYFSTYDTSVLILGIFAISNVLLITTIIEITGNKLRNIQRPIMNVNKKVYINSFDITLIPITLGSLLNMLYYVLLFYATFGFLIWLYQIYSVRKNCVIKSNGDY